jgi:hypothetical protein
LIQLRESDHADSKASRCTSRNMLATGGAASTLGRINHSPSQSETPAGVVHINGPT